VAHLRYARTFRRSRPFGPAGGRAKDGACGRELAGMITRVGVYRNRVGEVFFRLSATAGRTRGCEVRAERGEDLDRFLDENGFRLLAERDDAARPSAPRGQARRSG
jgi:hypothetical protein